MEGETLGGKTGHRSDRVGRLALLGAVGAAFGASLCCIGPILFVSVGVGAGLGSSFEPLRPVLTALAAVALGIGFYTVYVRGARAVDCAPGEACGVPANRRRNRLILWTVTVLVLVLWSFNYWSGLLL